ncbi:hypothetical protein ACKQTC_00730 [Peptococcus simiae]|uniref:Uncharacterized protein n=1 Tax=Peptococcus simiae TaxID=1643805 RepID=A0ABW9GY90_9FIRM
MGNKWRPVSRLHDGLVIITLLDILFVFFVQTTLSEAFLRFGLRGVYGFYLQLALPWAYMGTGLLLGLTVADRLGCRLAKGRRRVWRLLGLAILVGYAGVIGWHIYSRGDWPMNTLILTGWVNWICTALGLAFSPALLPVKEEPEVEEDPPEDFYF